MPSDSKKDSEWREGAVSKSHPVLGYTKEYKGQFCAVNDARQVRTTIIISEKDAVIPSTSPTSYEAVKSLTLFLDVIVIHICALLYMSALLALEVRLHCVPLHVAKTLKGHPELGKPLLVSDTIQF